jgi:VanZ family protein
MSSLDDRLGAVRALAPFLFWPALLYIVWGELTPHPPHWTALVWDKALHFTAYFGLATLAAFAWGLTRRYLAAAIGLFVLSCVLEIVQGFIGRDADLLDEISNGLGIAAGALAALALIRFVQREKRKNRRARFSGS